ncbi:hypothetical protein PM082_006582 [Marasmius tenuissimus]|nr:hypothetical protein PM082_006582 [Marasmius tenuissimus]
MVRILGAIHVFPEETCNFRASFASNSRWARDIQAQGSCCVQQGPETRETSRRGLGLYDSSKSITPY